MLGVGVGMGTHGGKEFPSKHTTLVPLPPKRKRKEHHSMCPRSVPNKTMGLKNTDGKEWTLFPESFTRAHPLLCGQPRLVMLQRPPGGATMRWPVRLGLLSSVWAPERDSQSLLSTAPLPAPEDRVPPRALISTQSRPASGEAPRPPQHTLCSPLCPLRPRVAFLQPWPHWARSCPASCS